MLSIIGVGNTLGLLIDVPIIVRSLVDSFAFVGEDELPLPMTSDFLTLLDTGTDPRRHGRIVHDYHLAWWMNDECPDMESEWLSSGTVGPCVEYHADQLCRNANNDRHVADVPLYVAPSLGHSSDPGANADLQPIVDHLIDELPSLHGMAAAMQTTHEKNWDLAMRRASGFYDLHEKALLKETDEDAEPTAGTGPDASLPDASRKWTWGESLTQDDVLGIDRHRSRVQDRAAFQSGNDATLESDSDVGYDSTVPMSHGLEARHSEPSAAAATSPPRTEHGHSDYFCGSDRRLYDPLKRAPSISTQSEPYLAHPFAALKAAAVRRDRDAANAIVRRASGESFVGPGMAGMVGTPSASHASPPPADSAVNPSALAAVWSVSDKDSDRSRNSVNLSPVRNHAGTTDVSALAESWDLSDEEDDERSRPLPPAVAAALGLSDKEDNARSEPSPPAIAAALSWSDNDSHAVDGPNTAGTHSNQAMAVALEWTDDELDAGKMSGTGRLSGPAEVSSTGSTVAPQAMAIALEWTDDGDDADEMRGTAATVPAFAAALEWTDDEVDAGEDSGTAAPVATPAYAAALEWTDDEDGPCTAPRITAPIGNNHTMPSPHWSDLEYADSDGQAMIMDAADGHSRQADQLSASSNDGSDDAQSEAGTVFSTNSDMAVDPDHITFDRPPDYIQFAPQLDVELFNIESGDSSDQDDDEDNMNYL